MPYRSTRERIRDQIEKAAVTLDRPLIHLQRADLLAKGRMVEMETALPVILEAIAKLKSTLMELRSIV